MATWVRGGLAMEELKRLTLTPEEGFVLSRLDDRLTTADVASLTGLPQERVKEILERLTHLGAVQSDAPIPRGPAGRDPIPRSPEPPPSAPAALHSASGAPPDENAPSAEGAPLEAGASAAEGPPLEDAGGAPAEETEAEEEEASEPVAEVGDAGPRATYERHFRTMSPEARIARARSAHDDELMALCFDADPMVLTTALENPRFNLTHARFAARWHPTSGGLDALAHQGPLFSDPQVQRLLLRNAHLSELTTKRLLGGKRMLDAYKASIDTDVPERTRMFARGVLRAKFGSAQGEERAGIICTTEGRVLAALAGLTLDGRATSILCARSYTSALFVQNLARFGSCPPPLLAHLLRQPIVRRQQHLKNMLLQHPNTPTDAKRRM